MPGITQVAGWLLCSSIGGYLESPESKPAKPVLRTAAVMGNGQNLEAVRPWPVNDR